MRDLLIYPLRFAHGPLHQMATFQRCFQSDTYTIWNFSSHVTPPLVYSVQYKPDLVTAEQGAALPLTWSESRIAGQVKPEVKPHIVGRPFLCVRTRQHARRTGQPSGQMRVCRDGPPTDDPSATNSSHIDMDSTPVKTRVIATLAQSVPRLNGTEGECLRNASSNGPQAPTRD